MWFIGAVAGFIVAIVAHASLCRVFPSLNSVGAFLLVGAPVGIGLAWSLLATYGPAAAQTWAALLIYGFACELYIFLFTLAMSSISANLLVTLLNRSMTDSEIAAIYDSRQMVMARLDRLVAVGLLKDASGEIRLTAKGERIVSVFDRLRGFFGHPSPAQDSPTDD